MKTGYAVGVGVAILLAAGCGAAWGQVSCYWDAGGGDNDWATAGLNGNLVLGGTATVTIYWGANSNAFDSPTRFIAIVIMDAPPAGLSGRSGRLGGKSMLFPPNLPLS